MFTREEAQALVASVRVARTLLDPALAGHADGALSKILGVLPAAARAAAESMALYAPVVKMGPATRLRLGSLREAAEQRRKVRFGYLDLGGRSTNARVVRPLGCVFWGETWTPATWCESRTDFRNFRIDRIEALEVLDDRFRDEPGKTLADLVRAEGADLGG